EVQKVRRIKKTRPVQGELPVDKVVTYEVTEVVRRVVASGKIEVLGGPSRGFSVTEESVDQGHAGATHPKLTVPADPLEVLPLGKVVANATVAVSREVGLAVNEAVTAWSQSYDEQARAQVVAGQL